MGNSGNDRRIDNIEFTVSDIARSREFHGKAFGWTLRIKDPPIASSAMGG
jgi:predicted enzyme related to lactoylglutathione lyase